MGSTDDVHPVVKVVATVLGVATGVWSTWCTVIAFVGGTMPLIGLETSGGFGLGVLWILIFDPLAITVAYWISMAVLIPIFAATRNR